MHYDEKKFDSNSDHVTPRVTSVCRVKELIEDHIWQEYSKTHFKGMSFEYIFYGTCH